MAMFQIGQSAARPYQTDWDLVFRERLRRQREAMARGSGDANRPTNADAIAAQGSVAGQAQPRSVSGAERVAQQGSVAGQAQPRSAQIGPGSSTLGAGVNRVAGQSALSAAASGGTGAPAPSSNQFAEGAGQPGRDPQDNTYGATGGLQSNITPNRNWYGNGQLPQASVLALADDPGSWNTRYAQSRGYGPGVENLLDRWMDPGAAYMLSLGSGDGGDSDQLAKLDFVGGMLDSAFSRDLSGGLGGGLNPRDIVQQVFGSSGNPDAGSSPLGAMLYGGQNAGNWGGQVQQTLQFLEASLYGRMTPEVLGPYLQIIQREGELFLDWKMRNPHLPGNFGQWVLDRLGPSAGL